VLVPRIGAIILLVGFGFAFAQIAQLLYVVAVEGYRSWIGVLLFVAPTAILATVSAVLVLRREALGARLVLPLVVLVTATSVVTFAGWPPVGRFLDDYEAAALSRGMTVPEYRKEQGWSKQRYVEQRTADIRSQGVLGALGAVVLYAILVRAGRPRRPRPSTA
jgi:hypothetical protein